MESKIPVLVTGVGGGGHGHEIVKALKLAGRYYIIGVDMLETSYGFFDVDEAYTVPPASNPDYIGTLLDICVRKDIKVIIHGSEPELREISRNREHFRDAGIRPLVNSKQIIEQCLDKWATCQFFKKEGIPVPHSVLVVNEDDIPSNFPLPAVVKPVKGGGGSNNTYLVQERDELELACKLIVRQGLEALAQEYLGTPEDEFTVGVLHSLDGELVGSIALKRHILSGLSNRIKASNRTLRSELSPILAISSGISQGEVGDFPGIRKECEEIAGMLQSRGPLNIQCRLYREKVYPFEINPRFSGTTYMRALVGFNEPDILIRHHLLGEPLPVPVDYGKGLVVRGLVERRITVPDQVDLCRKWV